MKALCWYGTGDVRVEEVPDPKIENPRDAIVKITSTAICGSDLHLVNGFQPTMEKGDVLGHENMGEVVEVGSGVSNLKVGDKVVVPFVIACGNCFFCDREMYSLCDISNPNAKLARDAMGQSPAGLFGFSHLLGGFAGGQAEYLRVPFADVGPFKVPSDIEDDKVLFLSDIFPTAYMAAENLGIEEGDTVAIWGGGPVGQLAVRCAWLLGAARVIMIDEVAERLAMAQSSKAEIINYCKDDVYDTLMAMTGGQGPARCMDAVGLEAHAGGTFDGVVDRVKSAVMLATDRPHVLRQAIMACRKGGTISVPGVYVGLVDHLPFGAAMNKGLTIKMGQTHVQKYMPMLFDLIEKGEIDPSFIITHKMALADAPHGYDIFNNKEDECIKVVLKPDMVSEQPQSTKT
ncbi:MAG: zinc-dependent alcohol dehydrogenase [Pyrinomonadaceae bacterium]